METSERTEALNRIATAIYGSIPDGETGRITVTDALIMQAKQTERVADALQEIAREISSAGGSIDDLATEHGVGLQELAKAIANKV